MQLEDIVGQRWCVYGHFVGGACVYVGFGELAEAFGYRKRGVAWGRATKNQRIDARIFERFPTRDPALEMARSLLIVMNPPGNLGATGMPKGRAAVPIRCLETGVDYAHARVASEATGININTLKACLAGRIKTAGGKHWRRIQPGIR